MVREVCACLKGKPAMSAPSSPTAFRVWADAASYLSGRVQGSAEEMRGRKPDMSRDAAAALRMVLGHIIESQKLFQARQEAGQALDKNRQKVVEDICNAGPKAISGKALTQRELERVDSKHKLI